MVKSCIEETIGGNTDIVSRLFFKHLFYLDFNLKTVFPGNVVFLNRKFTNMLGIFKSVKHLEDISQSVGKLGERHILQYGVRMHHLDTGNQALILALEDYLQTEFTAELKLAWQDVLDDTVAIMKHVMAKADLSQIKQTQYDASGYDPNLLAEIGGEAVITTVHQRFYDVMFEHPWLKQFFYGKSKTVLIIKQTEFMIAAFNGPNNYTGDTPAFIHMHMFITEEIADLRETILKKAIIDEGLSISIADRWLKVDHSFRSGIVKKSAEECVLKCRGKMPIVAKKPF